VSYKGENFVRKKYGAIIVGIEKNGNLDVGGLDSLEKKILASRDVIYVYIGQVRCYIGQTKKFEERHKRHIYKKGRLLAEKYQKVVILYGELVDKNLDYLEKRLITLFNVDNGGKKNKKKIVIENRNEGNHSNNLEDMKVLDSQVIVPFWENELFNLRMC